MLTEIQKQTITDLRIQGVTYAGIAEALGLSPNTVKSVCHRAGAKPLRETDTPGVCKNCGKKVARSPGAKPRFFCCDQCRYAWWNRKRRKQPYHLLCHYCGQEFISYGNRNRKFCGRECYRLSRYGEGLP